MRNVLRCGILAVLASVGTTNSTSAACLPADVVVFYGNGIRTTPADAEADRVSLEDFLNRRLPEPGEPSCQITVLPAYNNTENEVADLIESARGLRTPVGRILGVLSWLISDETIGDHIVNRILNLGRNDYLSAHEADLDVQLTSYRRVLDAGGRVIVIAHSQGNLFANEAYEVLAREFASLQNRMRIVSVATPDGSVAGIPFVPPGPHTTLHEDFIHLIPGALDPNTGSFPPGACGHPFDCHAFIQSYLDATGAVARARILEKVKEAFPESSLPVAVVFSNFGTGDTFGGAPGIGVVPGFTRGFDFIVQGTQDVRLSSIDLALAKGVFGGAANEIDVRLMDDAGNFPSTTLEVFHFSNAVQNFPGGILSAASVARPILRAGQRYWLMVGANPSSSIEVVWLGNSVGDVGQSVNVETGLHLTSFPRGTFRIKGTPEGVGSSVPVANTTTINTLSEPFLCSSSQSGSYGGYQYLGLGIRGTLLAIDIKLLTPPPTFYGKRATIEVWETDAYAGDFVAATSGRLVWAQSGLDAVGISAYDGVVTFDNPSLGIGYDFQPAKHYYLVPRFLTNDGGGICQNSLLYGSLDPDSYPNGQFVGDAFVNDMYFDMRGLTIAR